MRGFKTLECLESLTKLAEERGASTEDAVDIVYQAYMLLYNYARTREVRDEEFLLRRIVINLTINEYHRGRKAQIQVAELSEAMSVPDPHAGPERILEAEQELQYVTQLLDAISRRTRQMFLMQKAGYSYDEIAKAFVVKATTVWKHVDRGKTVIEEYFKHGTLTTLKLWFKW